MSKDDLGCLCNVLGSLAVLELAIIFALIGDVMRCKP